MLYSMTGYGRAEMTFNDKTLLVEVKSLNGKQFDVRLNIPSLLNVSFITYHHQSCLFALAVSENDIPFTIAISVNGKPYQSQKFSEQIITII